MSAKMVFRIESHDLFSVAEMQNVSLQRLPCVIAYQSCKNAPSIIRYPHSLLSCLITNLFQLAHFSLLTRLADDANAV